MEVSFPRFAHGNECVCAALMDVYRVLERDVDVVWTCLIYGNETLVVR